MIVGGYGCKLCTANWTLFFIGSSMISTTDGVNWKEEIKTPCLGIGWDGKSYIAMGEMTPIRLKQKVDF